jgi:hypothetical protein
MLRAARTPNPAAESKQLIRSRAAVPVRIWDALLENERQEARGTTSTRLEYPGYRLPFGFGLSKHAYFGNELVNG